MSLDHDVFAQVIYPTDGTLMDNFMFIFLFGKWQKFGKMTKICFIRYRLHCCAASQNGSIIGCAVWDEGKTKHYFFVGDNRRADLPMSELCGFFAPSSAPVASCPWKPFLCFSLCANAANGNPQQSRGCIC